MRTPPRFTKLDDKHHITTHNLSTTPGRPPAHCHCRLREPHTPAPLFGRLDLVAPSTRSPLTCWPLAPCLPLPAEKKGTKRAADGKAKKAESSSEEEESDEEESEEEEEVRGETGGQVHCMHCMHCMHCHCPLLARTSLQVGPLSGVRGPVA